MFTTPEMKFQSALDRYAKYIIDDYMARPYGKTETSDYTISFDFGTQFVKVVMTTLGGSRSVHSFVSLERNRDWPTGTILKAASWRAPQRISAVAIFLLLKSSRTIFRGQERDNASISP